MLLKVASLVFHNAYNNLIYVVYRNDFGYFERWKNIDREKKNDDDNSPTKTSNFRADLLSKRTPDTQTQKHTHTHAEHSA